MPNQKTIHAWSTVPNQNDDADPFAPMPEGLLVKDVNDRIRQIMASAKAWLMDSSYWNVTTGSASNYVLETQSTITNVETGFKIAFVPHRDCEAEATINVGPGATDLLRHDGTPVQAGDILEGLYYEAVADDNQDFRLTIPVANEVDPVVSPGYWDDDPFVIDGAGFPAADASGNASVVYNYTEIFDDSAVWLTVMGNISLEATEGQRDNWAELKLQWADDTGDYQDFDPPMIVKVGNTFFDLQGDNHFPVHYHCFCFQQLLTENEKRTNSSWRLRLVAAQGENQMDNDKTRILHTSWRFDPTME